MDSTYKNGNKLLIISDKTPDYVQYNEEYTDVTWESYILIKWQNEIFFNEALSAEGQTFIDDTKVTADETPDYDTEHGNDITDKVFLLSITEVEKYFSLDDDMICKTTDYEVANNAIN